MAKRQRGYIDNYRPRPRTRVLLARVEEILEQYQTQWPLTCRQIFYILVGQHGYPKTENAANNLNGHLSNARRGGWIPFEAIRGGTLVSAVAGHYRDPDEFWATVRQAGNLYQRDKLVDQERDVVVWCEAAGMVPRLAEIAEPYSADVLSNSGFDSLTSKKDFADRINRADKPTVVLHLGDYDPSGESMFDALGRT